MQPVVGIFRTLGDAQRAVEDLKKFGFANDRINILAPGAPVDEIRSEVPTTEGEQPGIGKAVGAVVGAGLGTALGTAAATAWVPGVGPVVGIGVAAAAFVGAVGALGGAAAGGALENALAEGLPKDEWFVYEDALRHGRSLVVVLADNDSEAQVAREIFSRRGAESIDAARERWWIGLRSTEEERYVANGKDFKSAETYRRGFEAALHPDIRGRTYESVLGYLWKNYPDDYSQESFHDGYERGRQYCERERGENVQPSKRAS
ncbi:MAG TPA: hypothetical protein VGL70_24070 [Candidatus Binatia bacterium]|jgi:hypothetical protein